ncbi:hypothetical protein H1Q60_09365 [Bacillus velezensis]|nr:hypothetical protein H1Q60_09365 [Bacillus velezensis]
MIRKTNWLLYGMFLLLVCGMGYLAYSKFQEFDKARQGFLEKQAELKKEEIRQSESGGAAENHAFFEAFLNYSDIDKRYEAVKKYTTEKGFDYAFPSRSDKKHSISVQSKLRSLESYSKPIDDSTELFLNVVEVSTTANSVTSHQVLIVQTKMKKEKNKWLVDDVQVKGNG